MFTGIIESIGVVRHIQPRGAEQKTLAIDMNDLADSVSLGDSVAVNGVCLTISRRDGRVALFDASRETLSRTTLNRLSAGSKVNLERAMAAQGRFGGHFVQGHIDGVGTIQQIRREGEFAVFRFAAPQDLLAQMVLKGSVAVDGISLTIAALDETGFEVALIPTTLQKTIWQYSRVGDAVNIEVDILVKIIRRQLQQLLSVDSRPAGGITLQRLAELGFC